MYPSIEMRARPCFGAVDIETVGISIEGAIMHCQSIACTSSMYMGLTSAEGKKIGCFK